MQSDDPVVITGMGAVSPLGVGVATNWERLLAGKSGIVRNDRFDVSAFASQIAGLVPSKSRDEKGFDPTDFIDPKDVKKMDVFIQYGLGAAQEALEQAGWMPESDEDKAATATIIASGVGGSPIMAQTAQTIAEKGPRRLSPFTVPAFLANLAAGWVSIRYGFTGPIGTPVTACAASAQAIGDGLRLIHTGEADVVVCGGAEGSVDPISIGGFAAARALCTSYNDAPEEASRPFDAKRAGFVLSEGAAMIVIERLSHAQKRGATPLAVLSGYGTSADAYHLTAGHPEGLGAQVAMRHALKMAGISPDEVDYINAHSTSTEVGDAAEIAAISGVFGARGKSLAVTSTKSSTGHLLGAAGGIEAVYSVMALRDQTIPASLNLEEPDPVADKFDLVPNTPKQKPLKHVLSNSFGFGGVNASLVFSAV
ncbi:beta-ketoacyl-ACP synthase II [Pelagibacterium xiamenense]|uniref:beta-ketoacyl-ACP synthase II n=1 Tax=Pelagibacterium xiamenense TaxID=2901140 RepID=UPI001E3FD1A3|nr:beta-ketoacyl-ACP synthase II [Pelagibacterium xiamenense]MCD7059983.1 beta-ketoacyl-ACP synthase II [Pelagibacterium xiamenense]